MTPRLDHPIILFDGVCNLCNASVDVVLRHDRAGLFRFASLQSEVGRALLREHGMTRSPLGSVVLLDRGHAYARSAAVARIALRMRRFRWAAYLLAALPAGVSDLVYEWIARNRYRWFGRKSECRMPTPQERERFLE